jgi:hypothetical protein
MPGREHPGALDVGVALGFYFVSLEALALITLYGDAEGDAPTPRGPEQYDALARLAFYIPALHTSQLSNTIIPGTFTLKPYVGVRFDRVAAASDVLPVVGLELLFTNDHRGESCLR